jgi:hypothetical protein
MKKAQAKVSKKSKKTDLMEALDNIRPTFEETSEYFQPLGEESMSRVDDDNIELRFEFNETLKRKEILEFIRWIAQKRGR